MTSSKATIAKLALGLGGLAALAACSTPPTVRRPSATVYAADVQGGARVCTVPQDLVLTDAPVSTRMVLQNDGGWCGIMVAQPGPRPYRLGLVTTRAQHGRVYVHTVGDATRLSYTPDPGFIGDDAFAIRLMPDSRQVQVAVTVQAGPAAVVTPPPPPAAAPAAPTRPRRRS
ncbi:hypothetical protein C8P66_12354 [Humitalea rosea]|uniref:Lipoprotein n=1 Tax=Humitalea rosea TaxID=990373 RepID=A0A2W7INA3_9PROT|nr:hypothetical protein [Humitalea rosea]PZW40847.1 hypothetical protein C8P66_12354 [Humitalea rosea]